MTIGIIILVVALGFLYSEFSAKSLRVKQLEDILTILQNSTGFYYTFNDVARIYRATYNGKHLVDLEGVQDILGSFMDYNIYRQIYSDIDGINELKHYQGIGLSGGYRIEEIFEKIECEKIKEPKSLKDWHAAISRNAIQRK